MKRKENGLGTIKQRKDGRWEGQFSVNGKRFSVYGKTQSEVRKKLTDAQSKVDNQEFIKPDKIKIEEWTAVFMRDYLVDVKPSTVSLYEYFTRVHIRPALGHIRLQKLTGPMIQAFYTKAQTPHKIKLEDGQEMDCKGLSPRSMKSLNNILSRCLSQAVKCGYIRHNPCEACTLPSIQKKEMHTITDIGKFLKIIKGDPYENLFITDVFTGMRQSEIIGLTWDCVDFSEGLIHIEKQYHRIHSKSAAEPEFTTTKNGKKRIVAPAQFVIDALDREQKKQATNKLKHGPAFCNKENFVFTDEVGRPMKYTTIYSHLKELLKQNGMEDIRFHDLRHTFATLSIENGDDIKTVSDSLGHSTTAFTMDVYGHVTESMKKRSGERMQAMIDGLKKDVG